MAKGDKPVVKVYGKRKNTAPPEAPEYADLAAFWLNEDGKLGGMWSRDIIAIKMRTRDGATVVVDPAHYFCNLRDEREAATRPAARPAAKAPAASAAPDFGDDDIPFRQPFVTWY